jgi:N utilization substance protein B
VSARGKARKRALDVLFEAEQRERDVLETLRERMTDGDPPIGEYTVRLVEGVVEHCARIDDLLATYSVGWPLERMPAVDRNVLRLGLFEVLWADDIPDAVAVNEAVALVRDLSTDDSPAFVNGLLGRILGLKETLAL